MDSATKSLSHPHPEHHWWFEQCVSAFQRIPPAKLLECTNTVDIEEFVATVFPPDSPLGGVGARILETGVHMEEKAKIPWAPRWSTVAMTRKTGKPPEVRAVKEIFYRLHDCLHQLWGIPTPVTFSEEERQYYKRCQMAGEVAVLAITEFCYGLLVKSAFPDFAPAVESRLATKIFPWSSMNRSRLREVTVWLDAELHECEGRPVPKEHAEFVIDYRAMLQRDRDMIDINWNLMKAEKWHPGKTAPKDMLPPGLTGLALSLWMIDDFIRLLGTSAEVDWPLREFNKTRRTKVVLPEGWAS